MINYKEICSNIPQFNSKFEELKFKIPLHVIWFDKEEWYLIPIPNQKTYVYHREDGPAKLNVWLSKTPYWYWYGSRANSEEQWLDPSWRKKAEVKMFI